MANFVSPGVYTIEKDVSDFAPSVNPSIVGVVGFASRGPVDEATLVTTPADLIRQFGTPELVTGGQGVFGALQILQRTNQVYFVRAATDTAKAANNVVPLVTKPHIEFGTSQLSSNVVYRLDLRAYDKDGTAVEDVATSVYIYRDRPGASGTGATPYPTVTKTQWDADNTHKNAAAVAGFAEAFNATNGSVTFSPDVYGDGSGIIVAREGGNGSYLTLDTFYASGVDYTGTYLSATPIDVTDLTFQNLTTVETERAEPIFGDAAYTGSSLFVPIKSDESDVGTTSGLLGATNTASGVTFNTSGQQGGYQLASLYPGKGYNYSAVNYQGGLQFRGIQATVGQQNNGNSFVNINSDGGLEETFVMGIEKPTTYESSTVTVWPEDILSQSLVNANSNYVKGNFYTFGADGTGFTNAESFSATVSGIPTWTPPVSAYDDASILGSYLHGPGSTYVEDQTKTFRALSLAAGTYEFKSGNNGDAEDVGGDMSDATVRAALIGTASRKDGLNALDAEDVPISMAVVPGVTDQAVQNALITLAESTQNFLAVVSPPIGLRGAQQAIEWTNGKATGRTAAINSSYAAVYWPWVKQFNAFNGTDQFYDPAIYAIRQMCFTDEVSDPWFAPAGIIRGRLTQPTDVEVKLNLGDRDALYSPGNIVNPITKFTTDGIVIYGQRTGQRAPTALDRINVRRLMIYLRRLVLQATRRFVFEPNDPVTWAAVRNVLSPALGDIQQRRGITQFKVICDETTNTPLRVDRNELWCKVMLKPTKTAEVLVFELNLTNQSAEL
jgi:phage tail sheath protein FI